MHVDLSNPEKKPPRDGFGHALVELGADERVCVLSAGVSESVRTHWFAEKFPKRFFQMGIAEQNMIGVAAGLALAGKIPFAASFGSFMPARSFDQIRVSVCYNRAPVKILATHCGLNVGEDGASAQMLEDFSLLRALPGMTIIAPADYNEAKAAVIEAAKHEGPVYIRVGRDKAPIVTQSAAPFRMGKITVMREGTDVTIAACGPLVFEALLAAEELKKEGIHAEVLNVHTIKPIDKATLIASAKKTGCLVSAEEHQVHGGLNAAIAECLGANYPIPIEAVAVQDSFGGSGKGSELLAQHGLNAAGIVKKVHQAISRK